LVLSRQGAFQEKGDAMNKQRLLAVAAAIAVAGLISAGPAFAQQVPWNGILVDAATAAAQPEVRGGTQPAGSAPDTYGTSHLISYAVGPCDAFVRTGSGVGANNPGCEKIEPIADGGLSLGFPIHLPSGASMQYMRIYYYANSTAVSISAGLYKAKEGVLTLIASATPPLVVGNFAYDVGPFSETVDNTGTGGGYTYHFLAFMNKAGAAVTGIHKIDIYYRLQVSPAPAVATFSDVPIGHWAYQYIEALAASGITGGCGVGVYCPGNTVTRAEMAVFIAGALGLHYPF
jgi:hypothetical protein